MRGEHQQRAQVGAPSVRAASLRDLGRIEKAAACAQEALARARALGDAGAEQGCRRLLDSLPGAGGRQAEGAPSSSDRGRDGASPD
ncbi:hypothetical protein [Nonomuraea africana]|uniref:hypothetical protein n=1 Tax=Nonomuraea africana TaxID=46171 RepID=UPI0033E6CF85